MTVKLNQSAYKHAKKLIKAGHYVRDSRDDGSEHQPASDAEDRFIRDNGISEYGRWHLGLDDAFG
jgi:hypothetical protein